MTEPQELAAEHSPQEQAQQAAAHVRDGALVIVPTETVYGLAVNLASAEARQRARAAKGLTEALRWVIHVPSADAAGRYLSGISPVARRIMRKAWPGPVALRLRHSQDDQQRLGELLGDGAAEVDDDGWYTLRCPEPAPTQALLEQVEMPVAIVGAAQTGFPALQVSEIAPGVVHAAAMVLDTGQVRYHRPSTLVQVDQEKVTVLRAGVVDARVIQRLAERLILFICSGNTCRSPMAAGYARQVLARRGSGGGVAVQSAGLHARSGMPATEEAVDAAKEMGFDLRSHVSQPATMELLRRADVVYTMTEDHRAELLDRLPWMRDRVVRLDPAGDIDDPIGGDVDLYRQVARRIGQCIDAQMDRIDA